VIVLQGGFTYWPVMNNLFHVAPLDAWTWLRVIGAALMLMLLVELEKAIGRKWTKGRQSAP